MKKRVMPHFTAHYQYRCRLCEGIYTSEIGGWDIGVIGIELFAACNRDSDFIKTGKKVHDIELVSYHLCSDGSLGATDFIGVKRL